ncbi:MAG: hypothetical protein AAFY98_03150 [Verrucomicrobiota bacterium]
MRLPFFFRPDCLLAFFSMLFLIATLSAQEGRLNPDLSKSKERISVIGQRPVEVPEAIHRSIASFLQEIMNGNLQSAYFEFFDGTSLGTQLEAQNQFVSATRDSIKNFGPFQSYALIDVKQPTERILLPSYLTVQEGKLLRWQLVYFRPSGSKWVLANLKVDDWRNYLALAPQPSASPPPDLIRSSLGEFFLLLQSDQIRKAFEQILGASEIPNVEETKEAFITRTEEAFSQYGRLRSYDFYDNKDIGSNLRLLTYFAYVDSEPLRWQFFYRVENGKWDLINLRIDDLLDEALLEM